MRVFSVRGGRVARLAAAVLAGCALTGAVASSASAAGWLPIVNASPILEPAEQWDISGQAVAFDGDDNAYLLSTRTRGLAEIVEIARRAPGEPWGEPQVLYQGTDYTLDLRLVANANGDLAAGWIGVDGQNHQRMRVARLLGDGSWSNPVTVSAPDVWLQEIDIAIHADGAVTAIWTVRTGPGWQGTVRASHRPIEGPWIGPVDLTAGEHPVSEPSVGVDAAGAVTATWLLWNTGTTGKVQSKMRSAAGVWSDEAVDVSPDTGLADLPRLVVAPDGTATAVWQRRDRPEANGFLQYVEAATRVDGIWSEPVALSPEFASNAVLAVGESGDVAAMWFASIGSTWVVQSANRPAGGSWGPPASVYSQVAGLYPSDGGFDLNVDPAGNATAVWQGWLAPNTIIRAAHRPAGGQWQAVTTISAPGSVNYWPDSAVDGQGHVVGVWSGLSGTQQAVRSRIFDPVPPELREVDVPEQGVVGVPLAVSADAVDRWSTVATSWKFGDGKTAMGAAAEHCYRTAGARTVEVRVVDGVGNAATAEREIVVAANPEIPEGSPMCGDDPAPGPDPDPGPSPDPTPEPPGGDPVQPRPQPVVSKSCVRAKKAQRQARTKVQQAKRSHRRAATPAAKRKWRLVVRRRQVVLRKAAVRTSRACKPATRR